MNKKKRISMIALITILLIVVLVITWSKLKDMRGEAMSNKDKDYVTKEYLMEIFDITEEEIEGIDVDKAVVNLSWTLTGFDETSSKEAIIGLLELEQERIDRQKELEDLKTELSKKGPEELNKEYQDFNKIKYISFAEDYETYTIYCLVDFDNSKCYRDVNCAYNFTSLAKVGILTQEDKDKILQILKDGNVDSWKNNYENKRNRDFPFWEFHTEFQDGSIITNWGTRVKGGMPDEYYDVINALSGIIISSYPDPSSFSYITFTKSYENYTLFLKLDLKNSICYRQYATDDENFPLEEKEGILTQEDKDIIIQALKDGGVMNWGYVSYGHEASTDWEFRFEYGDRSKIYYSTPLGEGGEPEGYDTVVKTITDIIDRSENNLEDD